MFRKKDKDKTKKPIDYSALTTTPVPTPVSTPTPTPILPTPRPTIEPPSRPKPSISDLSIAVRIGRIDDIKLFVNSCNVNDLNPEGRTLLCVAIEYNQDEIVKYLLSVKANVTTTKTYETTPLHIAASYGRAKIIPLLLAAGADIEARDYALRTPLHEAIWQREEAAVTSLLNNGANVNVRDSHNQTPASMLLNHNGHRDGYIGTLPRKNEESIIKMFKMLLEKNVDLNTCCADDSNHRRDLSEIAFNQGRTQLLELIDAHKAKRADPQVLLDKITKLQADVQALATTIELVVRANPEYSYCSSFMRSRPS